MRRNIALLVLCILLALNWLRSDLPKFDKHLWIRAVPDALPPPATLAQHLGPFHLEAAWELQSRTGGFGSYSALLPRQDGRLEAVSDLGYRLAFSPPGEKPGPLSQKLILQGNVPKTGRDFESATGDAETGTIWLATENTNRIYRFGRDWKLEGSVAPRGMAGWKGNSGPESMVRLADGRFLVLCECFTGWTDQSRHPALIFPGDPLVHANEAVDFIVDGASGFRPVDMAQMPDGRVLVLMRALVWPMPQRFAGRIAIGDPKAIREGGVWQLHTVASLSSNLRIDNFEGLAIVPRTDGKLTVWLISDDNLSKLQRTLLWKLAVDPSDLPT